jgi:hypothetical protein
MAGTHTGEAARQHASAQGPHPFHSQISHTE